MFCYYCFCFFFLGGRGDGRLPFLLLECYYRNLGIYYSCGLKSWSNYQPKLIHGQLIPICSVPMLFSCLNSSLFLEFYCLCVFIKILLLVFVFLKDFHYVASLFPDNLSSICLYPLNRPLAYFEQYHKNSAVYMAIHKTF